MIKIGVPCCFMYPDPARAVFGHKTLLYAEKDMMNFLARENVMPVLIPELTDEKLFIFLKQLDGFVFQGGTDVAPQTYGEEPILNGKWKGDAHRDAFEIKILDFAVKNKKPVLGICRGLQIMNVYFGGTLYQDISTQKAHALVHRDAEKYDQLSHEVVFSEGKLLDKLYRDEPQRKVNTVHHQGVKDVGENLEVLARSADDNLVEAFCWNGAEEGKVMAVQWHPEFSYNFKNGKLLNSEKIYRHFLQFCK